MDNSDKTTSQIVKTAEMIAYREGYKAGINSSIAREPEPERRTGTRRKSDAWISPDYVKTLEKENAKLNDLRAELLLALRVEYALMDPATTKARAIAELISKASL